MSHPKLIMLDLLQSSIDGYNALAEETRPLMDEQKDSKDPTDYYAMYLRTKREGFIELANLVIILKNGIRLSPQLSLIKEFKEFNYYFVNPDSEGENHPYVDTIQEATSVVLTDFKIASFNGDAIILSGYFEFLVSEIMAISFYQE